MTDQGLEQHIRSSTTSSYAAHIAEITFAREQVPPASFAIYDVFRMPSCNEICYRSFKKTFLHQCYNR